MKTYFNHLDIHTNHIFDFETDCYFLEPTEYNQQQTLKIISQLVEKLEIKLIKATNPSESDGYTKIDNMTITVNHTDFDYWFALKLRQYQIRMKYTFGFLEYHLTHSFNGNKERYEEFLELILLQYKNTFFNKGLTKIVKKYRKNILLKTKRKAPQNTVRKQSTSYNTLLLKELQQNPKYIKEHIVNFMDVWSALKKEEFICKNTSFENFKNIFKSQPIKAKNRITWTGTNKELQWFLKYLVYDSKKIVNLDKDIWVITTKCFMKQHRGEFTESQLRNASGIKLDRKKHLETILSGI